LKILYFSRDYTSHDHRVLSALVQLKFNPYYLRLERRGHSLEARALPPEVQVVRWAGGSAPVDWRSSLRLLLDLKRVLRKVRPDLVLAGPIQRTAFLTALAGFRPLVSMSWGYDLLHDVSLNILWTWATRFTLKRSSAMLGDCGTIRSLAVSYGMHPDHIVTFPWGVDLEHFSPGLEQFSQAEKSHFTLLSTRSWEPLYGVDVIAKAFVQASQQMLIRGGPQLRLIMLGNGSQAAALRQIFIQGGVQEQVHFPGQIGYTDLPRYYRSADLYLSASHSDGSSISLLEAMACGKPVLVSDIPGNREWVTSGEQGWLFSDGNAQELYQGIMAAVDQRARLPEMGRKARLLAEQRANWENNFQQMHTLFALATKSGASVVHHA
jgi:L-malate glycosyltransferase